MKIYGYSLKPEINNLLEMREVTFQGESEQIKKIANFLNHVADLIEKHGEDFGHEHILDFYSDWREKFPNIDIIVSR